ncbi:MAG: cytochrome c oxidase assembly protein [Verrucomicrobia bacterium]|nr:cytochrome c oxidase assembly protein [Verrucomicrobiota bacterium]
MIDWRHWHNEPWLIGGLVVAGWLWAVLAGPFRARLAPGQPWPLAQAIQFYSGLLFFYLAVGSPLDQVAERYLFSAHMLQHQLMIYPAAILFLRGLPSWMIDPVLGAPGLHPVLRLMTHPLLAGSTYTIVVGAWHAPMFYDWALQDRLVHIIEHLMFFGAAILYWWPLFSPSRVLPPRRPGVQMVYLLGVLIAMTPVFAYITFSHDVLYPTYEYAPRLFPNFSAADDQLLAGVMMKLVGVFGAMAALAVAFFGWYRERR